MFDFDGVEGMIFDCDGTILDSMDAWEEAERDLLLQAPALTQEDEDFFHSAPIEEACAFLHEKFGVGASGEEVLEHLDSRLMKFYSKEAIALPGAIEFVLEARKHCIPCVVLSSSPRRYLHAGLSRVDIVDEFVELIATDEVGFSKMDHEIYEHALEILGSSKETTWAIDDAIYANRIIHEFGIKTIAPVNGRGGDVRAELASYADIVVETLEELIGE